VLLSHYPVISYSEFANMDQYPARFGPDSWGCSQHYTDLHPKFCLPLIDPVRYSLKSARSPQIQVQLFLFVSSFAYPLVYLVQVSEKKEVHHRLQVYEEVIALLDQTESLFREKRGGEKTNTYSKSANFLLIRGFIISYASVVLSSLMFPMVPIRAVMQAGNTSPHRS
jgi:hypothetical protein